MSRRAAAAGLLLAFLCLFLGYTAGRAAGPAARPTPSFAPVHVPAPTTRTHVIVDPAPSRSSEPRPAVEPPVPELITVTPRPVVVAPKAGVRGEASWYDDPRKAGLYAAAGPALRVGDWRGRTVTVCASTCFAVVLNDFCQCYGNRVIDLSSNAFRRLAPLGIGVTDVTVTW